MLNSDDSTLPARDSSGTTAAVLSEGSGVSQESALEYLQLWREEREKWSFKKKIQYWLLQNMYDRTKASNKCVPKMHKL